MTAVFSASLSMPKTPKMIMLPGEGTRGGGGHYRKLPPESVPEAEEHEDRERHDDRDQSDHPDDAGTAIVHSADALRVPGADTRSATR